MRVISSITFAAVLGFAALLVHFTGAESAAQSGYFNNRCSGCHAEATSRTCNGCHKHGVGSLKAKTNKASYAAGETITVTITGGGKSGWVRVMLFDQDGNEVARSSGNQSGMGSSATLPATLTASAPSTPGTYTWKAAWYGNKTGMSSAGATWTADPDNPNHGRRAISMAAFTVTGPPDTTAPTVTAFTLPATSDSLNIPVETFTATDDVAVSGYLVTTSSTAPAAGASGWSSTKPATVKAPGNGSITFYAWVKDAGGNVSASSSATVEVTYVPSDPKLTVSTLSDNSYTSERTLNVSGTALDDDGITRLTVNRKLATVGEDGSFSKAINLVRGNNTITVSATDGAGNVSTDVRTIIYDPKAPVLIISGPADNLKTKSGSLTVSGKTNEAATVSVKVNNGSSQAAEIEDGNTFNESVNIEEGTNTIEVTATDAAGNTSTKKRTVVFDQTAPALEITGPAEDTTVATKTILVSGTVSDALRVKVTISVNGRTAAIGTSNGKFHRRVTFTSAGSYPITVTATDAVGNVSSVTRTIVYEPAP